MLRRFPSLCLVLYLATVGALHAQTYSLDPAAKVNGVVISTRTFERGVDEYMRENQINIGSVRYPDRIKALRREALDLLINKELVWQAATEQGLVANEDEVDQAVAQLKAQFKSETAFTARMAVEGFSEASYRDYVTRLATWRKYMGQVAERAQVSEQDIEDFYQANPEKFVLPEMLRARHILIKVRATDSAGMQAARETMAAIQAELEQGEDFAILATRYSQDDSAGSGGDLGFFARGKMVAPFEEAVFALEPGQVSGVVQTVFGLHLIKLEQRQPPRPVELDEAREQVRDYLLGVKQRQAEEEEIQALRATAKIEILTPL
jgi:parvulin-like peptidyl-prolyl isomerase